MGKAIGIYDWARSYLKKFYCQKYPYDPQGEVSFVLVLADGTKVVG